jgi:hypothetical protein
LVAIVPQGLDPAASGHGFRHLPTCDRRRWLDRLMPKYLPFSRRELRSRFATWAKKNWRTIGIFGVGLLLLLALETYLLLGLGERAAWKWYVLGIVHAGVVAAFLYALGGTFIAHDREAIFHLRGAWGEENTRDELKRAKRKKVIWDWVDSVTLASGDIDHLVVTRAGGLVALDSKWRNQVGANDRDAMVKSAHRVVKLRAEGVMQSLLRRERGGHRAAVNPLRVRPAVVVWGAWKEDVPSGAQLEGVDFVGGRELVSWLRTLEGETVTSDAAKDLIRRLEAFRAEAWPSSGGSAAM